MDIIQPVTNKQLKRAATDHSRAMFSLHRAIIRVAVTTAKLAEMIDRADDASFASTKMYEKCDVAMGDLEEVYGRVAKLFDVPQDT